MVWFRVDEIESGKVVDLWKAESEKEWQEDENQKIQRISLEVYLLPLSWGACLVCDMQRALVYRHALLLDWSWRSDLAQSTDEVRVFVDGGILLEIWSITNEIIFLLFICWLQDKVEVFIYVYSWVLHILYLRVDLLGNKTFWLWCFDGSSYHYCYPHRPLLHLQVNVTTYIVLKRKGNYLSIFTFFCLVY